MTLTPTLKLQGLDVFYGKAQAVRQASLTVQPSRMTTLIGSNGAGKTTLLRTVAGLIRPSTGTVLFHGEDITGLKVEDIVGRGISVVPEGRRLFSTMSVEENLRIGAYCRHDKENIVRDFDRVMEYFPDLRAKLGVSAESLSGGQQQMVAVGRGLMSAPRLLLLDEPTIGLAPGLVRVIAGIIKAICANGVDILLVEQNASMALELADDAYVLENGTVTAQGLAADLLNDEGVKRAYLGI